MAKALYWISALFLLSVPLFADQVTLKNGDIVTGSIVKKDGGNLTVKSQFMGEVTIPWDAVTSIKSDNPLYVVLPGGAEANGKLSTENGTVQVQSMAAPAATTPSAPLDKVSAIRNADEEKNYEKLQHPSWFQLWGGYVDLGFSIARGNADTQTLNTAFNAARNTRTDQTRVFLNQIYSTAVINNQNGSTANALRGGISYDHNFGPRYFLNTFNTDETDQFQQLNLRFVAGAGIGYHAIKSERAILDLLVGGDYNHASFYTMTQNLAEVNVGDTLAYKLSKSSSLVQSFRIYDAPGNNEYRMNFDLGAVTTIRKWLSWHVSGSDRFLNAPTPGTKRNDLVLTTGIRASFIH